MSPLLLQFRADGCTEYLTAPLNRIGGNFPVVAWATDDGGGFNEPDIALLEAIRPALAAVIEMLAIFLTARGVFSTYLDRDVGKRVLDGQIKRGHTEPLRAVIMATDLRNFSSWSDRLPGERVIGLFDDYFEIVASSVQSHGGNVLKFIGDGVLAVFGTDASQDQAAARAALSASGEIIARLGAHRDGLRAGIGLHIGTAMYGNVGSADRLDFTVIGPAVNLAFRLEALTKELGCTVLVSRAFADAAACRSRHSGCIRYAGSARWRRCSAFRKYRTTTSDDDKPVSMTAKKLRPCSLLHSQVRSLTRAKT